MKRLLSLPLVAVLAVAGIAGLVATAPVATAAAAPGGRYVPVDPVRLLDTRSTGSPLGQGIETTFGMPDSVPRSATAAVLNLTVDAPTAPGFLTVYPAGNPRPTASSLNKRAGETRSNSVTVALPANGSQQLTVFNQLGTSQVVVDLFGYYTPDDSTVGPFGHTTATYHPYAAPVRAIDTRTGARYGPNSGLSVALSVPAGSDVAGVVGVAVNITAVDPTGPGYLTAWQGTDPKPLVSTVNYGYDAATPNFAVVPAVQSGDGLVRFTVANAIGTTDILVDVFGLYSLAGSGGTTYRPVVPQRLGDTRTAGGPVGQGQVVSTAVPVAAGEVAVAANLNVTGVDATAPTYLTAYPDDAAERPGVSNLNPARGQIVPNAVQTTLGPADAGFDVFNFQGAIDVVSDLQGYFVSADPAGARRPLPVGSGGVVTRF